VDLLTVVLLLVNGTWHFDYGLASVYWPGDRQSGMVKANGEEFRKIDRHIAHRDLPLGTKGNLCNPWNNICIETVVQDRGPFGAIISCDKVPITRDSNPILQITWRNRCYYWQIQKNLQRGWRYRGNFDITKPLAKKLKHRSFDPLYFFYE
jgi:hypothetical protein